MSYRIKTVATMTGIPRGTLLAWERRHDILDPRRTPSGYRVYSDADVAVLRRLKSMVDAGHPIGEAVALLREGRADTERGAPERWPRNLSDRLLTALLAFDRAAVDALSTERRQLPFERALDELYLPMLHRVGDLWEAGEASVAQEHYVSGWVREQMLAIFHALGAGPEEGPTAACALPPDEQHELGLLAVAIKLALRGWRVDWLGAQLPVGDLCGYLARVEPALLCLSVVRERPEEDVRRYAREVRACADPATRVFVGGAAVEGLEAASTDDLVFASSWEDLWSRIGSSPPPSLPPSPPS